MVASVAPRSSRSDVVGALGFKRVERVTLYVGNGPAVAEVLGVTHRYPVTCRVSVASAERLADAGVPMEIVHRSAPAAKRAS